MWNYSSTLYGLHRTSGGPVIDLQAKNGQNGSYQGADRQGVNFPRCYSPKCHKLLLKSHSNSGVLATEVDKFHDRFQPLKTVMEPVDFNGEWTFSVASSSPVGRNSLVGMFSHGRKSVASHPRFFCFVRTFPESHRSSTINVLVICEWLTTHSWVTCGWLTTHSWPTGEYENIDIWLPTSDFLHDIPPDSNIHGASMGPTWVLSAPDGPHIGPMNLAIGDEEWHVPPPVGLRVGLEEQQQVPLRRSHDDVMKWKHFRVTGPLYGEFAEHRWIPVTKASGAELWCFLWSVPE